MNQAVTPATDVFPILGVDHIELYVGNAKQSATYYEKVFGFRKTAYNGFETGNRRCAAYLMEQGQVRMVITAATLPDHEVAQHAYRHGDGVAVVALAVPDAARALEYTTGRGARAAMPLTEEEDEHGVFRSAAIHGYGDTIFKFVDRSEYRGTFAPGFALLDPSHVGRHQGAGLAAIDHIVGNVELGQMEHWVEFFERTMGFQQMQHFDDDDISTEYSALMSKVMQGGNGKIKFPINEPAEGRRRSQIQEYLDYYGGPGVQHIAFITGDIVATVRYLRDNGVEFLRVPSTYYEELEERVGKVKVPVEELAELGILVDRDDDGYLLQLFTRPVEDRPTMFFEIIERHGSQGFGVGNFKSLFEAIEREQARRGNL